MGPGKLPPAIFHLAKSPKLHSISRLLDLFEVCRCCATLRTREDRHNFSLSPFSPSLSRPRMNIRMLRCDIAPWRKLFVVARSRRFLQTCSLVGCPAYELWPRIGRVRQLRHEITFFSLSNCLNYSRNLFEVTVGRRKYGINSSIDACKNVDLTLLSMNG